MLELSAVSKTFFPGTVNARTALSQVDLSIADGEFVTVIGGNGAGKSTLLNAVAGTYPIDAGRIVLAGQDITRWPEHRRARLLGRVFQDPMRGTAPTMQLDENLALAARRGQRRGLRWGLEKGERENYRALLSELNLGLEDRLSAKVGLLSGGQRQSLTLLMATLKKPQLLLLDEHTAALDPKTAETVLMITDRLVRAHRLTTLMITHNMRDALRLGDRLIMMKEGRVALDVRGEEKAKWTVGALIERFGE